MWISRIELTNFKSYRYQKFEFKKPANGRNIVLIGGLNGFGKTTLLEAIYLCFYGADAVPNLSRAGLHADAYGKFIRKALYGKAMSSGENYMEVEIEFHGADLIGHEVSRRWHFDQQGSYQEEEVKLYRYKDGIRNVPIAKEELTRILNEDAVPAHLAPFFFFDGEEVKKLADQDRREWIQQGMENLLGVVLLRGLRKRLEEYQNNKKPSGKVSMDESKLSDLYESLTNLEDNLEEMKAQQTRHGEKRDKAQSKRNEIHQRLREIGAGGGGIKQSKDITRELGINETELQKCDAAIDKILSEKLPFHLVNKQFMDKLKVQLKEEEKLLEWENKKQGLEPQKENFTTAFFSREFTTQLCQQTKDELKTCVNFAWQSLFTPKPDGCANELLHHYLEPRQRQRLIEQFDKISLGYQEIKSLLQTRGSLRAKIEDLKREYIRLEALHDDGTLQQLQADLEDTQDELDKLNIDIGDLNRQIIELDSKAKDQRATYEREHLKSLQSTDIKSNLRKSDRVIQLINELMPRLFSIKTQELSNAVTYVFKQLAHKDQIDRIEIDEKGVSRLLSREGTEITLDRSAGENQIFATALIAGLAKTSGSHFPMVVDTPLGRLDSLHRRRILEFWLADTERQIILLSQDKEIDSEIFNELRSKVNDCYLLRHAQIGEGIGFTVAVKDRYFGDI